MKSNLINSNDTNKTSDKKLVPMLRFPGFVNEWDKTLLGCLFFRITEKNINNNQNVLTISAQYGLVSQYDYFNKNVASVNIRNYYIIRKGDFAYNKSRSQGYPFGVIKPLRRYKEGVVSTLYICFRAKTNCNNNFFEQYFDTGLINHEISKIAQEGARNHGLLNISVDDFFNKISIILPEPLEQQKIAECLSSIDEQIAATKEIVERLKVHKKGLMQKLFPVTGKFVPELRFSQYIHDGKWEEKRIEEVAITFSGGTPSINNKEYYCGDIPFIRSGEINSNKTELFLTNLGVNNSSAKIVDEGTILYALYGATSGEVSISKVRGAINQAILAIIPKDKYDIVYIYQFMKNKKKFIVNRYLQGGQGNLSGNIINKFPILFPSYIEQQKIAECLSSIDELIESYENKVTLLEQHKKGLIQQLFPKQ